VSGGGLHAKRGSTALPLLKDSAPHDTVSGQKRRSKVVTRKTKEIKTTLRWITDRTVEVENRIMDRISVARFYYHDSSTSATPECKTYNFLR
jgi:hypothetical protein